MLGTGGDSPLGRARPGDPSHVHAGRGDSDTRALLDVGGAQEGVGGARSKRCNGIKHVVQRSLYRTDEYLIKTKRVCGWH